MAIEFTCPGCQSRHACADHMVGRQFKCGGCGKLLEVPATTSAAGSGAAAAPRRPLAAAGAGDAPEEEGGMGAGLQFTLLIGGGIAVVLLFLMCLGGGAVYLFTVRNLEPQGPGVDHEAVLNPPPPREVELDAAPEPPKAEPPKR